jgi:PAS domain S-box-containing protein
VKNNRFTLLLWPYTLIIFFIMMVFEALKSEVFVIKYLWLSPWVTIIFVTLIVFIFLIILKRASARYYSEINQELANANVAVEAANQELQATNQELQATEEELKSSNEELNQQTQELQMLLQTIPEGIIRTDAKGKVLFCNKQILDKNGLSREDVLNKDIKNIVSMDDRPAFAREFEKVFNQGTVKEISFHGRQGTPMLADIVVLKDHKSQVAGTLTAVREFSRTGKIIEELDSSRNELNQKIEEMKLLHQITIDREKRVIRLKEQVETLKQELAKSKGAQNL